MVHRAALFPGVIIASLLGGALLAVPAQWALGHFFTPGFDNVLTITTLVFGFLLALAYVRITGPLSVAALGLHWHDRDRLDVSVGFLVGLLILGVLEAGLLLLGVHEMRHNQEYVRMEVASVVVQSFMIGLVVALKEEVLFRGALLTGLLRCHRKITAMLVCSVFYAATHYLKYPETTPGTAIDWYTGLQLLPTALRWFASPGTPPVLVSLFLIGLLLVLLRLRRDSLWPCIGLHAGFVTGYKIAGYCTNRVPDAQYGFFLSSDSPVLGWFAVAWLTAVFVMCCRFCPAATVRLRETA